MSKGSEWALVPSFGFLLITHYSTSTYYLFSTPLFTPHSSLVFPLSKRRVSDDNHTSGAKASQG
jgi:hypothetical protein